MKQFNTWVLDTTIYILDFLYRGRDFQRFWVLEVIARAPYFRNLSEEEFEFIWDRILSTYNDKINYVRLAPDYVLEEASY